MYSKCLPFLNDVMEEGSCGHIVAPKSLLGFHQFVIIYPFWILILSIKMYYLNYFKKDSDSCSEIMPIYSGAINIDFFLVRILEAQSGGDS